MPGFVDPRPAQEAELRQKLAELAAVGDGEERGRLQREIHELEQAMGKGHFLRRLFFGWGHRSVPW